MDTAIYRAVSKEMHSFAGKWWVSESWGWLGYVSIHF